MPGGCTKFQTKWLESKDRNGDLIGNWCVQGSSENGAFCTLCRKPFSISNSGISQLLQHSIGKKHCSALKSLKGQRTLLGNQSSTEPKDDNSYQSDSPGSISLKLNKDQMVTRAEAIWAMKVAVSNFSFSSCKEIVPLFQLMFEGNPVANQMHLSDRKISYILSHGLGPYFREQSTSDLKTSDSWFTLAFDETTTCQVKKQLDIYVRFWSKKFERIVNAYINSVFLGHADANIICTNILDTLNDNKLPLNKILMLSMDGPNVNLSVAKKLNEKLVKADSPELVNIGTCTLHKVHNSFSKAVSSLPLDIDQFAADLFVFFKLSAARREDLKDVQKLLDCEQKYLLRHVNSRWLTLGQVIKSILTVYPALLEYFLNFLPRQKSSYSSLQQNSRYRRIISSLKDPLTTVYLEFVCDVTPVLESYLALFQTEGPLVHILYNKMNELLRRLLLKFLKNDCVGKHEGKSLINIDIESPENFRPLKDLDIGISTRRDISKLKESERSIARITLRKCLIKLSTHLKETLPVTNSILRDLEVLHPLMRTNSSDKSIRRLCFSMKPLKLDDKSIDNIIHEWQVYRLDEDINKFCDEFCKVRKNPNEDSDDAIQYQRIDIYWANVLQLNDKYTGKPKYENLSRLIKSCLSLSHSNADVERGFSVNNAVVGCDRANLSEATITGLRSVKDAVQRYGSIHNIPITGKLLNCVSKAHAAYVEDKKKRQEDLREQTRKRIQESEQLNSAKRFKEANQEKLIEFEKKIKLLQEDQIAAQVILNEGNERLKKGVKGRNFKEINIASTMIETGTVKVKELTAKLAEAQEKKSKYITSKNKM